MNNVLLLLGSYYLITAVWPFLSIKSFEFITGPKVDKWLVYTVASLLLAPAILYLYAGYHSSGVSPPILFLALTNGVLLILIEIFFVFKKVIWKTYLLDAAIQIVLLSLLLKENL